MPSLHHYLRNAGYDLIEGPVRNHQPLQLWLKQGINEAELYYSHISEAFDSAVPLVATTDPTLNVDESLVHEYDFNTGLSLLQSLLTAMGITSLPLSAHLTSGQKLSIGFKKACTRLVPIGDLSHYLATAAFRQRSPILLKNANRHRILVITGAVMAQNLVATIETDRALTANGVAAINQAAGSKIDFRLDRTHQLHMVAGTDRSFPIAIKASRLLFDKGVFKGLKLVTDNRNFF